MKLENSELQPGGGILEFRLYTNQLSRLYQLYRRTFEGNIYRLSLTDGRTLNLSFPERCLPHLLGMDTKKLCDDNILLTTNAIQQLKELVQKPNYYYDEYQKAGKNIFHAISPFYEEKLKSFALVKQFTPTNISFVVKYNSRVTDLLSENGVCNFDYLVGFQNDDTYSTLGFVKNQKANYLPITNLYLTEAELKEKLNGQIFYPVYETRIIHGSDRDQAEFYKAKIDERITYLDQVMKIASIAEGVVDVTQQYREEHQYFSSVIYEKNKELTSLYQQMDQADELNLRNSMTIELQLNYIKQLEEKVTSYEKVVAQSLPSNEQEMEAFFNLVFVGSEPSDVNLCYIKQALQSLLPKEFEIVCQTYGLEGRTIASKADLIKQYALKSYANYYTLLKQIGKWLQTIYRGLLCQDPFAILLTDRPRLRELIDTLPKEEREVLLWRYGFYQETRASMRQVEQEIGKSHVKVKSLEQKGMETIRNSLI